SAPVEQGPVQLLAPRLLSESAHILLTLHRDKNLLHVSAVGDAPGAPPPREGSLAELVGTLPDRTLLATAVHLNYDALQRTGARWLQSSLFLPFQLHARAGTLERLMQALNTRACLAVGLVTPKNRQMAAPPVPAAALVLTARDPEAAVPELRAIYRTTIDLVNLLSRRLPGPPPPVAVESVDVAGVAAEQADLSTVLLGKPEATPLGELHLCWALDGDAVIVASHVDWLRQILEARHKAAPQLAGTLALSRHTPSALQDSVIVVQTGPLADLGALWLEYLGKSSPEVLNENWWREHQPPYVPGLFGTQRTGRDVQIGLRVGSAPENVQARRLPVVAVEPGSPAAGLVRVGDAIVGVGNRPFTGADPITEVRNALVNRPNARFVELLIERAGQRRPQRFRVPFVDPIELLQRAIAIGKIFQRVVYLDDAPEAAGFRGFFTLELRGGAGPRFPLALSTPAASAPASESAPPPASAAAPAPPPVATEPASQPAATAPSRP
ncbi:MAG: hypothetical protein AB1716_07710, partial [Planctomycetota bacterium]